MTLDLKEFATQPRITDGAWGTQLQKLGLEAGACPELWNAENPQAIAAVAAGYVEAGSDVILTNTFGGNRFILARHGLTERVSELVEAGVNISRAAAKGRAKVFASLGPTGKIVMMAELPQADFALAFAESAGAIARSGADAIVLETFNELEELRIALQAVKSACDLPIVASMTFASGPDNTATIMGNSPAELAALAEAEGAAAVGANCGCGPDNYVNVAQMLQEATSLPVWIKANAGMPQLGPDGKTTFPMGAEEFASYAPKLVAAGANFIGGCCGSDPDYIRAIRAALGR